MIKLKNCAKCKKPNEFYKADKYWCKKCRLEYNKKYQQKPNITPRLNEFMQYNNIYSKDIEAYLAKINGKTKLRNCTYTLGEKPCGRKFKSKNNAHRYCPRCRKIIKKLSETHNNRPYKESVPSRHWEENSLYYDIKHL